MSERIKLLWTGPDEFKSFQARAEIKTEKGEGFYVIHAIPRPSYCDRGRWYVIVDGENIWPLDGQEGFPRYYFDLTVLQSEMEAWVNARKECRNRA